MYIDDISCIDYRVGNCCHLVDIVIWFDLWFAHHCSPVSPDLFDFVLISSEACITADFLTGHKHQVTSYESSVTSLQVWVDVAITEVIRENYTKSAHNAKSAIARSFNVRQSCIGLIICSYVGERTWIYIHFLVSGKHDSWDSKGRVSSQITSRELCITNSYRQSIPQGVRYSWRSRLATCDWLQYNRRLHNYARTATALQDHVGLHATFVLFYWTCADTLTDGACCIVTL